MSKQALGWVYILTNPAFKEGMIKIGFTSRDTPQERAAELSGATGVPTAFTVVWAARMPDAQAVEGKVHKILQTKRSNHNREFFECSIAEAIDMIETVAGKTIVAKQDNRKKSNPTPPQNNRQPEKVNPPKKSPYPTHSSSSSKRKTPPSTKAKNKGGVLKFLLGLAVVFLLAMLVIGWFVEKREVAQPVSSTNKNIATATATQTPPKTSTPVPPSKTTTPQQPAQGENTPNPQRQTEWRDSVQDVQLAWDKISADIQKDLHAEQQAWERKKAQTCEQEAKMGGHETEMENHRMACEIKWNAERTQYLRGFSIR